jgi:hypothetical protein
MKKYYLRNDGYQGNALIWWRPGSCGYTADLNQAGKYSEEQAKIMMRGSGGKVNAYLCEDIDGMKNGLHLIVHADYIHNVKPLKSAER